MTWLVLCKQKHVPNAPFSVAACTPSYGFESEEKAKKVMAQKAMEFPHYEWYLAPITFCCQVLPPPPPVLEWRDLTNNKKKRSKCGATAVTTS